VLSKITQGKKKTSLHSCISDGPEFKNGLSIFGHEKLHSFSESNNDLTIAAEGTSKTSYHLGLSGAVVPKS
jgi:hypothetical protein